jgi:hypothetical protein
MDMNLLGAVCRATGHTKFLGAASDGTKNIQALSQKEYNLFGIKKFFKALSAIAVKTFKCCQDTL